MIVWLRIILVLAFHGFFTGCLAQRQLVLLKRDEVLFRFRESDIFHSKLIDQKRECRGFLVEINQFSIITSQDTIELKKINKVLLPGKPWTYKLGSKMVTAGVGLFIIDQINNVVVQGNDPELNEGVVKASVLITAAGVPLLFFKKRWKKIGRVKLISVGTDSRFYKAE